MSPTKTIQKSATKMQNSQEIDLKKILDQTLYTYIPEKLPLPEDANRASFNSTKTPSPKWSSCLKHGLVNRLWPIVALVGTLEVVVGVILLIILLLYARDYDKLYGTEKSHTISLWAFCGLLTLVVNGMALLISLAFEKKKFMWFYILISSFLCVYIFVFAVMKIHFALLVLERDTYKVIVPENKSFLLNTACVVGIVTLLGSVIHFIGNVAVFTFYNLKYVQPILMNCTP